MYARADVYGLYRSDPEPIIDQIPDVYPPEIVPTHKPLQLEWKTEKVMSTSNPKVWGPAFWLSLHLSAAHYPENPSAIVRDRMKQRIMAIPYEVPCSTCRPHASAFIESNRDKLDTVVSNKHELGKFYVDFHNKVNKRYNKPEWTYEKAYAVYSGNAEITYL
jgi:FAD-linked sulfhydryl oxidase